MRKKFVGLSHSHGLVAYAFVGVAQILHFDEALCGWRIIVEQPLEIVQLRTLW
jgi:hypothetical protein